MHGEYTSSYSSKANLIYIYVRAYHGTTYYKVNALRARIHTYVCYLVVLLCIATLGESSTHILL